MENHFGDCARQARAGLSELYTAYPVIEGFKVMPRRRGWFEDVHFDLFNACRTGAVRSQSCFKRGGSAPKIKDLQLTLVE